MHTGWNPQDSLFVRAQVPPTVLVIVTHPIFHVAAVAPSTPPDNKTAGRALSPLPLVTGAGGHDHAASSSVGSTASSGTAALGASPLAAAVSALDGPPAKYASLQVGLALGHGHPLTAAGPS